MGGSDDQPTAIQPCCRDGSPPPPSRANIWRRIRDLDQHGPKLNSVIELNPDALADRRGPGPGAQSARTAQAPCMAFPILIKDNIATRDKMMTTAGSLALVGAIPPADAFVVQRLRAAGAVILGKTNLSEWADFRSTHGTSGWSGRGGLDLESLRSGSQSRPAPVPVPARRPRPTCAPSPSAPKPTVPSPRPAPTTAWLASSRPSAWSAASALFPSPTARTPRVRCARTVADAAILLGCLAGPDAG